MTAVDFPGLLGNYYPGWLDVTVGEGIYNEAVIVNQVPRGPLGEIIWIVSVYVMLCYSVLSILLTFNSNVVW